MRNLLFLGLFVSLSVHAGNLHDALEKAWLRNPQGQTLIAAQDEIQARRDATDSLTPSAPVLSFSQRGDQLNANLGSREWEAKLGLPLWQPGERRARRQLAETGTAENGASVAVLRLALAGELREMLWAWHLARNETELARNRLKTAQTLESSVERRIKAGDLAKVDLNLARHETLAARAALLERETRAEEIRQNWQVLTGDEQLPNDDEEAVAPAAPPSAHPRLEAARQGIALAQAKIKLAGKTPRDNPELGVFVRVERGVADTAYADSVGISLSLPLATEARNRPIIAAANVALIQAESEYRQAQARLGLDIVRARQTLSTAVSQLDLAATQRDLARENLKWLQKAFVLGETSLVDLLKTRATHHESELNYVLRQIGIAQAKARLNQVQGVLP
ncbi:MAG: TolC family protein [Sulfuricellaceae bacterium]